MGYETRMMTGRGERSDKPVGAVFSQGGVILPPFEHFVESYGALQVTSKTLWGEVPESYRIVLYGLIASADTAMRVTFEVMAGGALWRRPTIYLAANGGANPLFYMGGWELPAGASIYFSTSVSGNYYVAAYGEVE